MLKTAILAICSSVLVVSCVVPPPPPPAPNFRPRPFNEDPYVAPDSYRDAPAENPSRYVDPQPEPYVPSTSTPDPYGPPSAPENPRPAPAARSGEYPLATPTANPNQVVSPHAPHKVIDTTGMRSGQLARDPWNQKIFRIP